MDPIEALKWRYATKQFDTLRRIPDAQLAVLKEAMRLAPSSFGLQPWHFIQVDDTHVRTKIRQHAWNQAQVTDASHLFVLCRRVSIGDKEVDSFIEEIAQARNMTVEALQGYANMTKGFLAKMDDTVRQYWMNRQVYLALGTLLMSCAQLQIDACPLEGFEPDKVDEELGLKAKGLQCVVLCTLGYRGDGDKYATLAKVRRSQDETFSVI